MFLAFDSKLSHIFRTQRLCTFHEDFGVLDDPSLITSQNIGFFLKLAESSDQISFLIIYLTKIQNISSVEHRPVLQSQYQLRPTDRPVDRNLLNRAVT